MSRRGNPPLTRRPQRPSPRKGPGPIGISQRPDRRRGPYLAWTFSIAVHLTVFVALFWPHAAPPPFVSPAILVNLVEEPKPEPPGPPGPPGPAGPPAAVPLKATASQIAVQPAPRPAVRAPRPVAPAPILTANATPAPDTSDVLNESQLAGAASAGDEGGGGGGGGGGGCDTARILQQALQRDPLVRPAVEGAHRLGKAVMLWNGDWVRSGEQEGKGLSAVREAIIWELAFAPPACRNKQVHGMVVLSLADGNTRFAIGAGNWRWSDLLDLNGAP